MPLDRAGLLRARLRVGRRAAADEVEPRLDAAAEVGLLAVDAGVEQRDRQPVAVVARQRQAGHERLRVRERLRRHGRRERGADRVDALDLGDGVQHRDRARVEHGREAVEHARVAEVGPDAEPARGEQRQHLLLHRVGLSRPAALVVLGRVALPGQPLGDRRRLQHDDLALLGRDLRVRVADEPLPRRRARRVADGSELAAHGEEDRRPERGEHERSPRTRRGAQDAVANASSVSASADGTAAV